MRRSSFDAEPTPGRMSLRTGSMIASALVLGGNIRAGLEDNLYLPTGEMARSNGDLIEVAARMTRDVGRKVASVEDAKKILRLGEYAPRVEKAKKAQETAQA